MNRKSLIPSSRTLPRESHWNDNKTPDFEKKVKFHAVYDYGMGGVWFIIYARSKAEIEEKYPFLRVAKVESTELRTDFQLDAIQNEFKQDIDEPDCEMISDIRRELGLL